MQKISNFLDAQGYRVLHFKCAMRKYSIPVISEKFLDSFVTKHCLNKSKKIHFVTHSLGGIIVRSYLQSHPILNVGRVVMIAPPNHGSEMVHVCNKIGLRQLLGVSGKQLGTGPDSYLNMLPRKVDFDLGVIAGTRSLNPLSFFYIKGKNDGMVSVNSTKVIGMKDHISLPRSHNLLLYSDSAVMQISAYLRYGSFLVIPT